MRFFEEPLFFAVNDYAWNDYHYHPQSRSKCPNRFSPYQNNKLISFLGPRSHDTVVVLLLTNDNKGIIFQIESIRTEYMNFYKNGDTVEVCFDLHIDRLIDQFFKTIGLGRLLGIIEEKKG